MNSKDFIIHRLKENIKESFPRPEVNISHVVYPDKLKQFIEISAGVGGRAEVLGEGESIDDAVRRLFPMRYASPAIFRKSLAPRITPTISIRRLN